MRYKEITKESYNQNLEYYSKSFNNVFGTENQPEFKKMIEFIPGKKILDLGCGTGDHAIYFKKGGMEVTCIDFSEAMIKFCKDKGLNATVMDMENLEFEDESFDGIWAVTSLIHLEKDKVPLVISKIHKILKPKGILYVSMIEGKGEQLFKDPFNPKTKRFKALWEKNEFISIFRDKFDLIEFRNPKVDNKKYLELFFRKV